MREIKFRAWNPYQKCMEDIGEHMYWFEETGIDKISESNYIIIQYIGLKDKNGVEIYEGYILKRKYPLSKYFYYDNIEVKRDDWKLFWEIEGANPEYNDYEVVGNIFENPELLEKL